MRISRSDAISTLKIEFHDEDQNLRAAKDKAIEEMEKLDKIESIVVDLVRVLDNEDLRRELIMVMGV